MAFATLGWSLAAFAAGSVLLWWILRDAVVRAFPIPSLMLVPRAAPRRSSRRPPWWLWFFLLGLAIVAAAAAMPYVRRAPGAPARVAVLVETGIVGMAREVSETRLDLSRRAVLEYVERFDGREARFALATASAFPSVELQWADRGALTGRLAELTATAAPTDWTAALDLVRGLIGPAAATVVVAGSALGQPLAVWHGANADFPADLVPLPVGTSRPNRGIDNLTAAVRRDPRTLAETTRVEVAVRGLGPGVSEEWMRRRSGLVVRSAEGVLQPRMADPTYTVAADGSGVVESYSLRLAGRFEELEIALDGTGDALGTDDRAIVYFRPPPRVLVVEPRRERAATAVERLRAAFDLSPVDVVRELARPVDPAAHDLLVVNRRSAPEPSAVNTLVYTDGRDAKPVRFADHVPSRLTRYVNVVSPFSLRAAAVEANAPMRPALYLRSGAGKAAAPLVAWGEREGRRQVVLGWDWTGDDHDVHQALPTVWLHALDWLGPEESRPGSLWAGAAFPVGRGGVQLVGPAGEERAVDTAGGRVEPEDLGQAGRYRLRGDRLDIPFAVNARCADLRVDKERPPVITARTPGRPAHEEERKEPKDAILWLAAAIFLGFVEPAAYFIYRRRRAAFVTEA